MGFRVPKPLYKKGYTYAQINTIARKNGVQPKVFWKEFGVNTVGVDKKTGRLVYYPVDVERTFARILAYRQVSTYEFD